MNEKSTQKWKTIEYIVQNITSACNLFLMDHNRLCFMETNNEKIYDQKAKIWT